MYFNNNLSKTVISTAISKIDIKSKRINKTSNECNEEELKEETSVQLKKFDFSKFGYVCEKIK